MPSTWRTSVQVSEQRSSARARSGCCSSARSAAPGIRDVVATDLLPHRVTASRDSGAGETWLAGDDAPSSSLSACDAVFECAGTDAALATALRIAKPAARVILVGIPTDDRTSFQASEGRRKGLALVFCRRMRAEDLGRAADLVASGKLALDGLVTEVFPLSLGAAAFEALASRRGLKVVVVPGTGPTMARAVSASLERAGQQPAHEELAQQDVDQQGRQGRDQRAAIWTFQATAEAAGEVVQRHRHRPVRLAGERRREQEVVPDRRELPDQHHHEPGTESGSRMRR